MAKDIVNFNEYFVGGESDAILKSLSEVGKWQEKNGITTFIVIGHSERTDGVVFKTVGNLDTVIGLLHDALHRTVDSRDLNK